jgi:hypothetical protein
MSEEILEVMREILCKANDFTPDNINLGIFSLNVHDRIEDALQCECVKTEYCEIEANGNEACRMVLQSRNSSLKNTFLT